MSSIGTGYDLSASTYSPEGRVFQVEYAGKAVEKSGVVVGLRCKDGVVMGVEKLVLSKMLVAGANRKIYNVDKHIGMATAGFAPDARVLVARAREEANNYREVFGDNIPIKVLNERLSLYVQAYTLYGALRPFGVSVLLGGIDDNGPQLYMIEPSGISFGYFGSAIGKGNELAKTEIEKLNLSEMSAREAAKAVTEIIYRVNDEQKKFELELSWICEESGNVHQFVPEDFKNECIAAAQKALESDDDDDDDDDDE